MTAPRQPNRRFGDFELLQRIGRDGPFHLFRARQVELDRLVTLKILPERAATLERAARLRREADAAIRLDHPGAVRVYEVGDVAGIFYVTLAHVEGDLLAERLKTNSLPPHQAIDLVRQLAEVLLHTHERGVIHGSLRPEVVWVTRAGQARLSGFGGPIQFEEIDAEASASAVGFLAPEQAGGRGVVGRATDVYGLGALLYAMVTGGPPHQGPTVAETCRLIRSQSPVNPSRLRPGLSQAVDTICLKCLRLSPARRYGTERPLARLIADLRRAHDGRTKSDFQRLGSWPRRHVRLLRTAALVLLLAIVPACADRRRHRAAWDAVTRADAQPGQYAGAVRHFERAAADQPFDPEMRAGLTLARFRTGQLKTETRADALAWPSADDEWSAIQKLAFILSAASQNHRDEARAAMQSAYLAGYAPRTDAERRLYAECMRVAAGSE